MTVGTGDIYQISVSEQIKPASGKYVALHHEDLNKDVYRVPDEIDEEVARLKLKGSGVSIDELLPEQKAYLESWED